jgi:hypothetical protein
MAEKPTNIERVSDLIDLDIQSGETVEIEDPTPSDTDVAVEFNADGSAELNYFPDEPEEQVPFESNLAEYMDDGQLSALAMELMGDFEEDRASRQEWEDTYVKGLDLLGFQYEDRDRPFPGASGVTHPMLAEAVTQFQAQAFKELLPSKGPVKAQVMGSATPDVELQASRVQDFMNYQITTEMEEYTPEMDQLLFYLPLAGSAFKKVYYDTMKQRPCSNFVPVDDLVVPYSVSDLNTCERITHIVKMSHNEVRAQQISGAYLDVEIKPSYVSAYDDTQDKEDELEGIDGTSDMMYELLEFHVLMDLPGFEDPDGMHLPYIITVDSTSSKVLSIRRNYRADDPMKQKIQYFVHYKFLPGLGFYGFGLIHMIGGLSRTATAALRQLVDAGTLSNLPAGFKARGLRIRDDETPLEPGEFRDVDAPGGALRDSLIPLPYKEPSGTLFQLLGFCVEAGQRFASVTNLSIGEGNQELPVGTTMALLEQGTRIMSAVHKRLHYAQKTEFKILARLFAETLPPEYPYMVVGGDQSIKQTDFDDRVDVIPVSDPNFFSMSQRISLAQQELQLVQSNPQLHNIKEAYRRMYQALGTENIEALFQPDPPPPMPMDPASENSSMLMGGPAIAFPEQDHATHIEVHLAFLENKYVQANPMAVNAIVSHVLQHVSLMAQMQAEQELQMQMQQNPELAMQLQQQEMMNQQAMAQGQPPMPNAMLENIKAGIELQLMQELMPRLDEILKVDSDPITALKAQELQIRAEENKDDKEIAEKRLEIDEEKIKSQEDIAAMKIQADRERNSGG